MNDALTSVLDQTFGDFELIVVDDASTDDSLEVLERAASHDKRVRILRSQKNIGLVQALNMGLSHARGALIARMDADDICLRNRFSEQLAKFNATPKLVLLGTAFDLIDQNGVVFGHQPVLTGNAQLQDSLIRKNCFGHPTTMMRADALHACGGYRALGGRYAQDYDLWLRMAAMGEIDNLPCVHLQYRMHDGQVSVDKALQQSKAAELYRQLALQRSAGLAEDLEKARTEVSRLESSLKVSCSEHFLSLSAKLNAEGRIAEARRMHWRGIKIAPFGRPVREAMYSAVVWRLKRALKVDK